jgi:hypothetical protein
VREDLLKISALCGHVFLAARPLAVSCCKASHSIPMCTGCPQNSTAAASAEGGDGTQPATGLAAAGSAAPTGGHVGVGDCHTDGS